MQFLDDQCSETTFGCGASGFVGSSGIDELTVCGWMERWELSSKVEFLWEALVSMDVRRYSCDQELRRNAA